MINLLADNPYASTCKPEASGQSLVPLVSIGLPIYNGERYLEESLRALLEQTMIDFEVVISDNASTDGTERICRKYQLLDKRIRYYRQDKNMGPGRNFMFVLREAHGRYFMWAAADDKWSDQWLEVLVTPLREKSCGCFSFGLLEFVDEEGNPKRHLGNSRYFPFTQKSACLRSISYFLYPESFGKANLLYGLFPIEDLKNIMLSGLSANPYADIILLHRIVNELRLIQQGGVVFNKRIHPANVGGPLYSGMPKIQRYLMLSGELFFFLPYEYLRATHGLVLKLLLIFLVPIKWAVFLVSLILRRIRY